MRRQIYLNKLHIPGFEPFASGYKPAEAGCRVVEPFASGYKTARLVLLPHCGAILIC